MIKEIIHDPLLLSIKSKEATAEDPEIANDLLDTLIANREKCVGMAANMIGISKRIIVFDCGGKYMTMFNPLILKAELPFEAEEGCLSLSGIRKTKRYKKIKVQFQNEKMQKRIQSFEGWPAQIIQHEIDHCNGVLI